MYSKIYRVSILIIFTSLISGCSNNEGEPLDLYGSWDFVGLEDLWINQVNRINGTLFFSTENGINIYDSPDFREFGLQGKSVVNTVAIPDGEFLAVAHSIHGDSQDTTIFKTINSGEIWIPFMTNYGGNQNEYTSTRCMDNTPENTSVIHTCVFGSLAETKNAGNSWDITYGEVWGTLGITYFTKASETTIWAGGENAIFQPTVMRSDDGGETWVNLQANLQIYEDIFFEAEARDIVNKEGTSSQLLLGLTTGVFKSKDNGETWSNVFEDIEVLTFTKSYRNPEIIYASGANNEGNLFFVASHDFGNTWDTVEYETGPTGIHVNDMVSELEEGKEVLYFATNQGVYSYTFEE